MSTFLSSSNFIDKINARNRESYYSEKKKDKKKTTDEDVFSKMNCKYRSLFYDFIVDDYKDMGFSGISVDKYWKEYVIYKLIPEQPKDKDKYVKEYDSFLENMLNIVLESYQIFQTCFQINDKILEKLQKSLFAYGQPSLLLLQFMKIVCNTMEEKKPKKKFSVACSVMILPYIEQQTLKGGKMDASANSKENKDDSISYNIYISLSSSVRYKQILETLLSLKNNEYFKFTYDPRKQQQLQIPEPPDDDSTYYDFPDCIKVSDYRYHLPSSFMNDVDNRKGTIFLVFNAEYQKHKFSFTKTSRERIKLNFPPFKKYEKRVSCNFGSTCGEPVLIHWLWNQKILKGRSYESNLKDFGTFYINYSEKYSFSNEFIIGSHITSDTNFKLYERIIIGFLYSYICYSSLKRKQQSSSSLLFFVKNEKKDFQGAQQFEGGGKSEKKDAKIKKKDEPSHNIIINLKQHDVRVFIFLEVIDTLRKLMIPCPGCFINQDIIKKNTLQFLVHGWNSEDCNTSCTPFHLPYKKSLQI